MNLVISANDKYITPAKVMLTSFMLNNPQEMHSVYFIYNAVQEENLKELETLVNHYRARFIPILVDENSFSGFIQTERFPINVYFRLLIPYYLEETEDRALWMDVDLVVNKSLEVFYYQPFDGKYLIACRDVGAQDRPALFGCPDGTAYINSGVLLINAAAMRKIPLSEYYRFCSKYKDVILWPDQDILNGMFAPHIKALDNNLYNCQVTMSLKYHNLQTARETIPVVHFVGANKPWHLKYYLAAGEVWDYYYLITSNKSALYSFAYRSSRYILRFCNRCIVPFVHAIRRWVKNIISQ